jgi:hypothetical protein
MSWTSGTATNYIDFIERLDAFLKLGHNLRPAYLGTGTGTIINITGTALSVQETITVSFSTASAFTVSGTVSGALGAGTVGVAFTSSVVGFNTTAGFVGSDSVIFVMTPPWQTKYKHLTRRQNVIKSAGVTSEANAFNHTSTSTAYISPAAPCYIGCEFNMPVSLRKFALQASENAANSNPRDFTLDWSDNGSAWTTQTTIINQTAWTASEIRNFDIGVDTPAHKYWRINVTANNGGTTLYFGNIYFIEPGIPTVSQYALDVSFRTFGEIVWQAPGDTGTGAIFVGFKEMFNVANDAYCWQTYGAANFDVDLVHGSPASQLRAMYGSVLALRNDTVRYWFIATGSYVAAIGNISTVYVSTYLGLLNLYSNAERFTYPLAIASCLNWSSAPARWSITGTGIHHGFWCGDYQGAAVYVRVMAQDGTPMDFSAHTQSSGYSIHPGRTLFNLNRNSDNSIPMFPIILHSNNNPRSCIGQLQGMQAISGDGVLSEDTITINRVTSLAIQGVYETSKTTYAAFELL